MKCLSKFSADITVRSHTHAFITKRNNMVVYGAMQPQCRTEKHN